jgi:hypothetical protein
MAAPQDVAEHCGAAMPAPVPSREAATVAAGGLVFGWVQGADVYCGEAGAPAGVCALWGGAGAAPRVHARPAGPAVGEWPDGVPVRRHHDMIVEGRLWTAVERLPDAPVASVAPAGAVQCRLPA